METEKEITIGVAAFNEQNQLLIVKRSNRPAAGLWTLPMGHVEIGETLEEAAIREVYEETGLWVTLESTIDVFTHESLELTIFFGKIFNGILTAGDDAEEVKFVSLDHISNGNLNGGYNKSLDHWAYKMHRDILNRINMLED